MDAYLSVVTNRNTGLFHGAVFRSRPTPSGCVRYLLSTTLDDGFKSIRDAAASANAAFPGMKPLDVGLIGEMDLASFDGVPIGSRLTVASPRLSGGEEEIEIVGPDNRSVDVRFKPKASDVRMLVALGRIVHDSSSGDDPDLAFRYDHYLFGKAA